jgi:glycosyltransferase involved in cell wall biosynthesis
MRIGVVFSSGPDNGGTFQYSVSVLRALRDHGGDVDIVVFYDWPGFDRSEYDRPNWRFHRHDGPDLALAVRLARLGSAVGVAALRRVAAGRHGAMRDENLDLVICPSTSLAAWWCGLPYVVAIHDVWHRYRLPGASRFAEPGRDIAWRRAAREAEIVLVESELGRSEVMDAYGVPEDRIRVLPTGPASFIWDAGDIGDAGVHIRYGLTKPYVFYPGGVSPAKNQRRLIEAVAQVRQDNGIEIDIALAGPVGDHGVELRALARSLGVDPLVQFLGMVPDEDMAPLYRGALCLCMPSYIGPTNMPIWEAFAAGCPVVSSTAGAMPEQVGDAGLLFDPDSSNELAACLIRLYRDASLRRALVERGHARIEPLRPVNWASTLLRAVGDALAGSRRCRSVRESSR